MAPFHLLLENPSGAGKPSGFLTELRHRAGMSPLASGSELLVGSWALGAVKKKNKKTGS